MRITIILSFSRELAIAFWNEFDNNFIGNSVSQEVINAFNLVYAKGFNFWLKRWRIHRLLGTFPEGFKNELDQQVSREVLFLADKQLEIINKFFKGDAESERRAFEEFGQGILYDDVNPREPRDKIHKMDAYPLPPIGYHRWHVFIRMAVLSGANNDRWIQIDRLVGLAWALQSELFPENNNPNNSEISQRAIENLRSLWLQRSFEELDNAFGNHFVLFPISLQEQDLGEPFNNVFPR